MRVEAVSWDDRSESNGPPTQDGDKWHVAVAPDDVKVVSLEQLDDLFRLSIVDAETKVWQEGMTEWLPLRVIAGIDDDAPEPQEPQRTRPRPPAPRSAEPAPRSAEPAPRSAPPPPRSAAPTPRSAPPPPRSAAPAPHSAPPAPRSAAPAPHSAPPAPRSAPPAPRSAPPAPRSAPPPPRPPSRAPVAQTERAPAPAPVYADPLTVVQPVPIVPIVRAPVYAEPLAVAQTQAAFVAPVVPQFSSVRPLVVSQPPRVASGSGGFGRFLVGLALIAGVSVTLYRNDVVRDAAHSLHQDDLYTRLQAALGGPSFGTLASLESSGSATDRSTVSSLSAALAAAPTSAAEPTSAAAPTHDASPAPAPSPANAGSAPPVVSLESLKRETTTGAKPTLGATSLDAPSAVAKPAAQSKPQPAPARAAPAPVAKATPPKNEANMTQRERLNAAIGASMTSSPPTPKKGKAKAGSEYDPLNPKL